MEEAEIKTPFIPEISYPWYQILQNPVKLSNFDDNPKKAHFIEKYKEIEQGDFFFNCEVIKPILQVDSSEIEVESLEYDVIILSQSCDLIQGKIELVTVAPLWSLKKIEEENSFFKSTNGKESLRKGYPSLMRLNRYLGKLGCISSGNIEGSISCISLYPIFFIFS